MRNVLAVLAGLATSMLLVFGIETLGTVFFPLPEGADPTNYEWLKNNIDQIPNGALVMVALAHLLGIVAGMYIASLNSKSSMIPAYIVGVLMLLATVVNLFMIPHPMWFKISDIIGALIGLGIGKSLGEKIIGRANA